MNNQCPSASMNVDDKHKPHSWYARFQIGPLTIISKCRLCGAKKLF